MSLRASRSRRSVDGTTNGGIKGLETAVKGSKTKKSKTSRRITLQGDNESQQVESEEVQMNKKSKRAALKRERESSSIIIMQCLVRTFLAKKRLKRKRIQRIHVSHIQETLSYADHMGLQTIQFQGRRNSDTPTYLNFSLKDPTDVKRISDYLFDHPIVNRLCLRECDLNSFGISYLQPSVHALNTLDLSCNLFGPEGLQSLTAIIPSLSVLKNLNISQNRIVGLHIFRGKIRGILNVEPFKDFTVALRNHSSIECLNISSNSLGGFYTSKNSSPYDWQSKLDEGGSEIGYYALQTAKYITDMLHGHTSLQSVNLLANGFPDDLRIANFFINCLSRSPLKSFCGLNDTVEVSRRKSVRNTALVLPHGDLTSFNGHILGVEMRKFNYITRLDLSDNHFFGDYGVNNFVKEFIKSKQAVDTLQSLILRRCCITHHSCTSLSRLLSAVPLTELDISENPEFKSLGCVGLSSVIRFHKSLTTVDFSETSLEKECVDALSTILSCNKVLTTLDLSYNQFNCDDARKLSIALNTNSTLTDIKLNNNAILSAGTIKIAELFESSCCAISSLDVSGNVMCGNRTQTTFDPLPIIRLGDVLMNSNRSLTKLNLSNCDIGARSTRRLMEALTRNEVLHTLVINVCNISEAGATHIGDHLPQLKGIKHLSVSKCNIGPIGAQKIFSGLRTNTSLEYLDISSNLISGWEDQHGQLYDYEIGTMEEIMRCLGENVTIKHMDLRDNRLFRLSKRPTDSTTTFDDHALVMLTVGIITNGSRKGQLTTLNLLENRLESCGKNCINLKETPQETCPTCPGPMSVGTLLDAAKEHPNLKSLVGIEQGASELRIDLKCPDPQMVRIIASELTHNHTLSRLDLRLSEVDDLGGQYISQAIRQNISLSHLYFPYGKKKDKDKNQMVASRASQLIRTAKLASFDFRMILCVCVRHWSYIGWPPMQTILEYLLGEGEVVYKLMSYSFNM